jgi:hypothetical protein
MVSAFDYTSIVFSFVFPFIYGIVFVMMFIALIFYYLTNILFFVERIKKYLIFINIIQMLFSIYICSFFIASWHNIENLSELINELHVLLALVVMILLSILLARYKYKRCTVRMSEGNNSLKSKWK